MFLSVSDRLRRIYLGNFFFWSVLLITVVLFATVLHRGVFVGPDSLTYLHSAKVFFTPDHSQASVQFPPLYSIIMTSLMALSLSGVQSAQLLNFVFFFSSVLVCNYLFICTNAVSRNKAILLSVLLMSSYVVLITHQQMMTESLFILLVFFNIALLTSYARNPTNKLVVLASLVAALSALSRYAGIAVIISTIFVLLIYMPEKSIKNWFKTGLLWGLSSILFGLWLLRNNILYSTFTGREVSGHERQFEGVLEYFDTFSQLYFPQMLPQGLRLLFFAAFIALTIFMLVGVYFEAYGRNRDAEIVSVRTLVSIITIVLASQVLLMISALHVDPFLPVQRRLLTPLYALLLLLHFVLLAYYCRKPDRVMLFLVYAGLYLSLNTSRLVAQEIKHDEYRFGYASEVYTKSPTITYMRSVESDAVIVSNGDDVLAWHLHREIAQFPKLINPRTNRPNPIFNDDLNALYCQLKATNGYLVFFNNIGWRDYLPSLESIQQKYPLQVLKTFSDALVLKAESGSNISLCIKDEL